MSLLVSAFLEKGSSCLGPPYLYITIDGPHVIKYSRDGCEISQNILGDDVGNSQLRSMQTGPCGSESNALYIADAGDRSSKADDAKTNKDSKILILHDCNSNGVRRLNKAVADQTKYSDAIHAYGVALDSNSNLYVSYQGTDAVMRFHSGSFDPMDLPLALQGTSGTKPGTFYQYRYKNTPAEGVRAIAFVKENLWVANERVDGVDVVNPDGHRIHRVKVRSPIGVYYSQRHNVVFISSKSSYGLIYAFDPSTYKIKRRFHRAGMTHPTGITVYEDTLFVLLHKMGSIITFDVNSGDFISTVKSGFASNTLEQIALSNC